MYTFIAFTLLLAQSALALVDAQSKDLFDKTFPRANSACNFNKKRIEVMIRGEAKYTEYKEKGFGEYVFLKINDKIEILPFSKSQASLYGFYKASPDSSCAKSLGFPLEGQKFAILIGEENRPHGEKLIVQIFDFETMRPGETIESNMLVEKAFASPGGFVFKSFIERTEMDMGQVEFGKQKFTYQDRVFPIWMMYTLKGFEIDPATTFAKLPWKKYFKDEADFYKSSAWNPEKKAFEKPVVYYAVKHAVKKKCVLFLEKNQKNLKSTEDWHCL